MASMVPRSARRAALVAAVAPLALAPLSAQGGNAERAVVVVDPTSAESLYLANAYLAARDLPRNRAIYLDPDAPSWSAFLAERLPGFEGALDHQRVRDHADFVVLTSSDAFFVPASGFVSDSCAPVHRFASASAFTLADQAALIQGGVSYSSPNQFALDAWDARAFDAELPWLAGQPSAGGKRYRIGALLGYTGDNGNTLQEVLDLIQRSAAADATQPAGTFYYVETTDQARSAPRDWAYPEAVLQMAAVGGAAAHILAVLPVGQHDCLGVMTGWAAPDVDGADYTLLPGAFGDHLTSFAGKFDTTSQTKMSEWIEKGASGTSGAVEEPCNYAGKFPHARLHVLYAQGVALGEAWFASVDYLPFQNLLYGDPLTAPFTQPPSVDVPGLPAGPVAGVVPLVPSASATAPGATIAELSLLVDGVLLDRAGAGAAFALDTTLLADGPHDLRVLARDDAPARNTGRFQATLDVSNHGLAVGASATPTSGDLATAFDLHVAPAGGTPARVRVVQGARVVAAGDGATTTLTLHGQNVGAGPARLFVEVDFVGGGRARSAPIDLDVAFSGTASAAPVAFGFEREAQLDTPTLVELPASYPDDPALATYTLLVPPAQATVTSAPGGPWVVLQPNAGASGLDSLTFEVTTPSGTSAPATVVLSYVPRAEFLAPEFFALASATPDPLPALAPGTAKTVTLHGSGFGPATQVEVDGVPLTGVPSPVAFVSPSELAVDLPQVDHLGPVTLGVRDGDLAADLVVSIAPTAAPTLQMGSGDAGQLVFQAFGIDAVMAGTPGATQVLVASVLPEPSDLPGLVHLDLGSGFTSLVNVGAFVVDPAQGWTQVHLPLANIPPATTIYAQTVELGASFPFAESNRQEFLVLF